MIFPPSPRSSSIVLPVCNMMEPAGPLVAIPVSIETAPLVPSEPEFDVPKIILPLLEASPLPLRKFTKPPVA